MDPDVEIMVLFGGLHVIGLAFAAMFLAMFMRSEPAPAWEPPDGSDDGGGGGGNDRTPPRPPSPGGIPLPDAVPARVRLREPARLADLVERRPRRGPHEPARPPARPRVPSRR